MTELTPEVVPDDAASGKPLKHRTGAALGLGCLLIVAFGLAQGGAAVVVVVIRSIATRSRFEGIEANGVLLTAVTLCAAPVAIGLAWFFAHVVRTTTARDYLGLRSVRWMEAAKWLLAALVFSLATTAFSTLLHQEMMTAMILHMVRTAGSVPLLIFAVAVAAPVGEEFMFRGFLLPTLAATRLREIGAVLATAALFTLLHVSPDALTIAVLFTFGILLGFGRTRTGSLYVPILMHVMLNAIGIIRAVAAVV